MNKRDEINQIKSIVDKAQMVLGGVVPTFRWIADNTRIGKHPKQVLSESESVAKDVVESLGAAYSRLDKLQMVMLTESQLKPEPEPVRLKEITVEFLIIIIVDTFGNVCSLVVNDETECVDCLYELKNQHGKPFGSFGYEAYHLPELAKEENWKYTEIKRKETIKI